MNTSSSNGSSFEISSPEMKAVTDLTQHEIEKGLRKLQAVMQQGRLPFIILIDDEEKEMILFKNALRRARVAVEFMYFKDGRQALDFFQGKGDFSDREMYPLPNLTVLDFKLTHSSGLNILEEIRNSAHLKELVVVGLTACEDTQELELARDLKINDCIRKPQTLSGLVEIVHGLKLAWLSDSN
jgi:two-component system response regulator